MTNEIKEILDYIDDRIIPNEKWEAVKDYITNLQQYYNDNVNKYEELLVKYSDLQEENERYKRIFEGKERFSKIMPDDTDFIILSKTDYDRQQDDIELVLIDYKSRNEKAIEFIGNPLDNYWEQEAQYLLKILQGDDKDE